MHIAKGWLICLLHQNVHIFFKLFFKVWWLKLTPVYFSFFEITFDRLYKLVKTMGRWHLCCHGNYGYLRSAQTIIPLVFDVNRCWLLASIRLICYGNRKQNSTHLTINILACCMTKYPRLIENVSLLLDIYCIFTANTHISYIRVMYTPAGSARQHLSATTIWSFLTCWIQLHHLYGDIWSSCYRADTFN